jgi:hypothetical protein
MSDQIKQAVLSWVDNRLRNPQLMDFVSSRFPTGNRAALNQARNMSPADYDIPYAPTMRVHEWNIIITDVSAVAYAAVTDTYCGLHEVIYADPKVKPCLFLAAVDNDHPVDSDHLYILRNMPMYNPEPQVFFDYNEHRTLLTGIGLRYWQMTQTEEPEMQGRICAWGQTTAHCMDLIKQKRIEYDMDIQAFRL